MVTYIRARAKFGKAALIFTHKELGFIASGQLIRHPSRVIIGQTALKRFRQSHVIGGHVGWPLGASHPVFQSDLDFVLCNPEQAAVAPKSVNTIISPAAWLSPDSISPWREEKEWDLTIIATTGRKKRWDRAFRVVGRLLSEDRFVRILLVVTPRSRKDQVWFEKLMDTELDGVDRSRVDLILGSAPGEKGLLSNQLIRGLLASTKVFALFSECEGTSKVVVEALKEGCTVFTLPEINHVAGLRLPTEFADRDPIQLANEDSADEIMEAISAFHPGKARDARRANHLRFNYRSRRRFLEEQIYSLTGASLKFDDFDNLSLALPAHTSLPPVLPPSSRRFANSRTSDVIHSSDWIRLGFRVFRGVP